MKTNDYMIRSEKEEDYRIVENLVRESFWNVYRPGCSEHYVIHVLRDDPAFVKELDFVMEQDGKLIGQNMFMKTIIEADDGRTIPILTMGPIGIAPELKRQGYGKALLDYSLKKATEMGFGAVLFEGNIDFYGKSGFTFAREFGIRYHDLPEGEDDSFFLCKELIPGYLHDVTGIYQTPQGYYVKDEDVDEFDKGFPPKEKLKLPGQLTYSVEVKVATLDDLKLMMSSRLEMLKVVNNLNNKYEFSEELVDSSREYFEKGDHTTVLALDGERVIGCASICYMYIMPTFDHPTGKRAHLMNVYTMKEWQRHGIAKKMVSMLIDEAWKRGVTEISLDATEEGRPLYERLGFVPSKEGMVLANTRC